MRYDDRNQPPPQYGYAPQPVPPRKKGHGALIAFIIGAVVLLGCGLLTVATFGQSSGGGVTKEYGPLPSVDAPSSTAKPRQTPKGNLAQIQITEGGYVVGEDLPPGVYRAPGARSEAFTLCSWEVRPGGTPDSPLDFERFGSTVKTEEQINVRLEDGDYFKTTGCERWTKR